MLLQAETEQDNQRKGKMVSGEVTFPGGRSRALSLQIPSSSVGAGRGPQGQGTSLQASTTSSPVAGATLGRGEVGTGERVWLGWR